MIKQQQQQSSRGTITKYHSTHSASLCGPQLSTPKTRSQASRLGRAAVGLIHSNSPRSQCINGSIEKIWNFGKRVDAELDIEVFRHKLLRSQVSDKPKNAVQDRRMLIKARLVDNTDIVHLRKEREAKMSKSKEGKWQNSGLSLTQHGQYRGGGVGRRCGGGRGR